MKKVISVFLSIAVIVLSCAGLAACGKTDSADDKTIKVGASITPHAEILAVAKDILAQEGYDLQIVEYNDYILPNTATESGELDANYFQHKPYLDNFNEENNTHLISVAAIHYEPFGIYAGKSSSLDELPDNALVSVPNDATNEARALLLLQAQGLITLKDGAGMGATVLDIVDSKIEIKELESAQLVRSLQDVDLAVINGNYAMEGGLKVSDALAIETADSEAAQLYANILVVKEGNENSEKIQALIKALQSDEVKTYITDTYEDAAVPIF